MASFTNLGPGCTGPNTNIALEYQRPYETKRKTKVEGTLDLLVIKKLSSGEVSTLMTINLKGSTVEINVNDSTGALVVNTEPANSFTGFYYTTWQIGGNDSDFDGKIILDSGGDPKFVGVTDGRAATTLKDARTVFLYNDGGPEKKMRLWYDEPKNLLYIGWKNTVLDASQVNPSSLSICWGSRFGTCYNCP